MATLAKKEFIYHKINNNSNFYLVYDFYHKICQNIFDKHELENYQKWLDAQNNNNITNIYTYYIIVTLNNIVIGGIANEIYKKSMCSLVSYIAIDEKFRGCGLSKILVEKSITETLKLDKNIKHIFIEVKTPDKEKDIDRQHIWTKLNFVPIDFIFQHPGCLRWKYYQIAIYSKIDNISISKYDLMLFLEEYFEYTIGYYDQQEIDKIQNYFNKDENLSIVGNVNLWKNM